MNLPRLSEPIDFCYDRTKSEIGIVHLGIGAFHRAHQAVYTDEVLDRFGEDWAICGVNLRSPEMRDALVPQNGLYPLLERSGSENHVRIIGSVKEVLFAPENPSAVLARMTCQHTRIVSLTITEKGYCHDPATGKLNKDHPDVQHDLANSNTPKSAVGFLEPVMHFTKDRRWF